MGECASRRGVLTGIALTAANLLFSREFIAADIFTTTEGAPVIGSSFSSILVYMIADSELGDAQGHAALPQPGAGTDSKLKMIPYYA